MEVVLCVKSLSQNNCLNNCDSRGWGKYQKPTIYIYQLSGNLCGVEGHGALFKKKPHIAKQQQLVIESIMSARSSAKSRLLQQSLPFHVVHVEKHDNLYTWSHEKTWPQQWFHIHCAKVAKFWLECNGFTCSPHQCSSWKLRGFATSSRLLIDYISETGRREQSRR